MACPIPQPGHQESPKVFNRQKDIPLSTSILQYLLQQGVAIDAFNEILPSLNEIFIKQVEGTPLARRFQEMNN